MNKYIKAWKDGAKLIIKGLANDQLRLIEENRPNKDKEVTEQINNEQLELLQYLQKVAETGKL